MLDNFPSISKYPNRSRPPIPFGNQTPLGCHAAPCATFQTFARLGRHDFRDVVVDGGDLSHVLLLLGGVKLLRKVPLFELGKTKGFGKSREGHLEETEGINETDVVVRHFQEFTPVAKLFNALVFGVVLVHHEIPIVSLKIVGQDKVLTCVV